MVNGLSTHIISISKATKSILLKEGVSLKKITDIEHGFDLEKFKNAREEHVISLKNRYGLNGYDPIIGVISRQIEWKGIQYIIPAFKEFLKSYPKSKLVLANAIGDYKKEIQKLLKDLPEGSYVEIEFESDVVSLYKSFDCFVHVPIDSEVEAFGQIYVESLAAGVPSIFTKSGIANDFCIDNYNCLIVDYKNSNEIYNALINIFENTNFRDEMTKNGLLSIEKFNFEDYYKKIKELYTLLIK
jgi:glycosyltransferase involved in cell wall biosynthesis